MVIWSYDYLEKILKTESWDMNHYSIPNEHGG